MRKELIVVTMFLLQGIAYANDNNLLIEHMLDQNCVLAKRVINNSLDLDLDLAVGHSIKFQSDCAFQELRKYVDMPIGSRKSLDFFLGAIQRKYQSLGLNVGKTGIPEIARRGENDDWINNVPNAALATGRLNDIVNMAARYCKWPEMADAIEALLDDGVDLDFSRNVPKDTVIVFENIQTTREAIHDNCPEIL